MEQTTPPDSTHLATDSAGVDVVVVSYKSADALRAAVAPLVYDPELHVIIVDNASPDDSLAAIRDLPTTTIPLHQNGGFAHGCNIGWRAGEAPFVLFLNPDARIRPTAIKELAGVLAGDEQTGIVAPLIRKSDGTIDFSLRRFPRLRTTYAQALFLQRLFPKSEWSDEIVRDLTAYEQPARVDWVSGACILVRRSLLERLDGWDEDFFLYCEDIDLCKRAYEHGFDVVFEPAAVATHAGGGSGSRALLLPTLAESRIRYAQKHGGPTTVFFERLGIGLRAITHMIISAGGLKARAGHARSLKVVAGKPAFRPN